LRGFDGPRFLHSWRATDVFFIVEVVADVSEFVGGEWEPVGWRVDEFAGRRTKVDDVALRAGLLLVATTRLSRAEVSATGIHFLGKHGILTGVH